MENRRAATLVGITVLVAFCVILGSVFYLRGFFAARDKAVYYAEFQNVGRLAVGDNVTVAGVSVGRVQTISLSGGIARVAFFVSRSVGIPAGSVAAINATDVFGSASVELDLGQGTRLPPGTLLEGRLGPGVEDIMRRSALIIDQTINLLSKTEILVSRIDVLVAENGAMSRSLENVEVVTANARQFSGHLEDYDRLLRQTLGSVDSTARSAGALIEDNSAGVKLTLARLENASARMDSLLDRIESGQGTAGRLIYDESLYQDLQAAILEARTFISELRDNPDKFFRVKVF